MKEKFQELKVMTEKYDPEKKYIYLWNFAGQQIFQHTYDLFVSEEVVCLIVFNAGKSLYEAPGRCYPKIHFGKINDQDDMLLVGVDQFSH